MNIENLFTSFAGSEPVAIGTLALNLFIGAILAYIVRIHFFRYSNSLSNRTEFTSVLPFIILTTILIISIVKSSLALSLGLVGALSIVRFRTPIKEPEELAYLFISIAIGLGLGANQILATVFSSVIILILMIFFMRDKNLNSGSGETYINLSGSMSHQLQESLTEIVFDKILKLSKRVSLKRYVTNDEHVDLTFYVSSLKSDQLDFFISDIKKEYPGVSLTILDQRNLPPM
jgi:hypothetical protein